MDTDTDIDYDHDHDWWEYFYDFYPDCDDETPEQAIKRVKKEREEAYERAMGIL